ncbi:MAG: hypothetical protein Q8Q38_01450 [bacterium]|nr:hypothetical protein [bacterium]MDZ4231752.1 hypothetical protein [Candidatus Pacearchaeota archaeon]
MEEEQPQTSPQHQPTQQPESPATANIERELEGLREQQTKRPQGQKLELLKREDVRTMEKDLALLRAKQATEEQARIGAISKNVPQQEVPERMADTLLQGDHAQRNGGAPLPIPPSRTRQIITRILIGAIALFAAANLIILGIWLQNR